MWRSASCLLHGLATPYLAADQSYAPAACCSHVFETVDDERAPDASRSGVDGQIKGLEALLEELRKRRSSGGS